MPGPVHKAIPLPAKPWKHGQILVDDDGEIWQCVGDDWVPVTGVDPADLDPLYPVFEESGILLCREHSYTGNNLRVPVFCDHVREAILTGQDRIGNPPEPEVTVPIFFNPPSDVTVSFVTELDPVTVVSDATGWYRWRLITAGWYYESGLPRLTGFASPREGRLVLRDAIMPWVIEVEKLVREDSADQLCQSKLHPKRKVLNTMAAGRSNPRYLADVLHLAATGKCMKCDDLARDVVPDPNTRPAAGSLHHLDKFGISHKQKRQS